MGPRQFTAVVPYVQYHYMYFYESFSRFRALANRRSILYSLHIRITSAFHPLFWITSRSAGVKSHKGSRHCYVFSSELTGLEGASVSGVILPRTAIMAVFSSVRTRNVGCQEADCERESTGVNGSLNPEAVACDHWAIRSSP